MHLISAIENKYSLIGYDYKYSLIYGGTVNVIGNLEKVDVNITGSLFPNMCQIL